MLNNVQYSQDLLQQLGVQAWQAKEDFVFASSPLDTTSKNDLLQAQSSGNILKTACLPFILIGEDLDSIWQNDATEEWLLLKNIAKVFDWDLEMLHYYDTTHLITEEAIFATLDELMEIAVDWVLSMDSESLLSEHLAEGLQVVNVSSLTEMLADPYAKKDCFLTLSRLSNQNIA